ncbi:caspase family protein [Streptomyces sp. AC495_CC817]|uniref:HD domain-containing protein n=1 Tax=Streptomyces sp. AC495_CC817 TaxID=2823900 RepID=UPI001C279ECA|nr:caspase family protein [Streptomyces sp. AC495_CC817]
MGENRRALIVAVPQYELSDRFADLTDTIGRDVELMSTALRSSGYSVEVIGATASESAGRSRILSAISRVCATAPEDATVLIHFTGHGLSVAGADHLVPTDAQLTWGTTPPQVDVDSLIPLDLVKLLKGCRADAVLLTVDACRDGVGGPSSGGQATRFPAGLERVAVLFGCDSGQTCGSDEELGSHFSRALADALHVDTSPRTFAEVVAHATRRTAEFARAARQKQTPRPHYPPTGPVPVHEVELCAGRTLQEEWTVAVRDPELWEAVACGDQRREELQAALVRLTGECAKWRAGALVGMPDPWADDDYPVRVLTRGLRPLLAPSQTRGGPLLDAGEFAALAAAPFVREAVYAMGIKDMAAVDPFQLDPATGDAGREPERVDLEHTFAAHSLLRRKGRELAGRGREEDAEAVAAWLLHRHVGAKEELLDAYAPQLLAPLAKAIIGASATPARIGELTDELVRVCRQTAVVPSQPFQGERVPVDSRWRLDEVVRPDGTSERWRPRELSWLIGVAGLLGVDLRQLPGVLVDNVGITDGLHPSQAVEAVRQLHWVRGLRGEELDLDLACPHPAVHAGLETLTEWADDAVQNIRQHIVPSGPTDLLTHLPDRVTCRRLRPQYDVLTKGDAYGVPLMRFGLAEDEMRELLMGTRLYGDRALALRELYQNALDACRYRQARLSYGEAARTIPHTWSGEIVFRQGTDEQGRPYVECEDNGVGMGHETLHGTFSRAGRRFEQSREYRREQAAWRRADPNLRIYPNSRFGIGVFSYFMLADEISIWTRATDEYGRAETGGGLRVDIASSGSLFRIRRSENAQPGGGTRVRLYLQADDVDVAEQLGTHIWRSGFTMRVERNGKTTRTWEEKALYYFGDHTRPVPAGPDAWFVEGLGCLLADGVRVNPDGLLHPGLGSARGWLEAEGRNGRPYEPDAPLDWHAQGGHPFGLVLDLRETHSPDISTNRNDLLDYDRTWVDDRIYEAGEDFRPPEWLTLEWLWAFARQHPTAAARLTERLLAADARITSRLGWNRTTVVRLRAVGCLPLDALLVTLTHGHANPAFSGLYSTDSVVAWRVAVLRSERIPLRRAESSLPVPDTVGGYPEPQPWETQISGRSFNDSIDQVRQATLAALPGETLTLGTVLRRLRRYAITGLTLPALSDLDSTHRLALDALDRRLLLGHGYLGGLLSPMVFAQEETITDTLHRFSAALELPVRAAMERARRYAAAGFALNVPEAAAAPPADLVATRRETYVLSWHPDLAPAQERPPTSRPSRREYEEVLQRYQWLGLPPDESSGTDEPESSTNDPDAAATTEERVEFQRVFGIPWHERDTDLTLCHLAQASGVLSLPVAEVVESYSAIFARRNLRIPDLGDLADRTFTRLESDLVGGVLDSWNLAYESATVTCPVPLAYTAAAVCRVQESEAEVIEVLEELAVLGLVESEAPRLVHRWRCVSAGDWRFFPVQGSPIGVDYRIGRGVSTAVRDGIGHVYLFLVASHANTSVGEARTRLMSLGPLFGMDTTPLEGELDADVAAARPTDADINACCAFPNSRSDARWLPPTAKRLVTHARASEGTLGESITRLSRYAPLGALWTEPSDSGHGDAWRDHRPTAHDPAFFEPDLLGEAPVGPLEVVRVAARFGWRIDHAWDRIALYRPFGVELVVDRPGFDTVPTWRDLILLTEYCTGSAPALTGRVTPDRIALVARELERPTRWVYERLGLYAAFFGLELPQEYPAEPAPTPEPEYYRSDAE